MPTWTFFTRSGAGTKINISETTLKIKVQQLECNEHRYNKFMAIMNLF
jgi:hypothetical protein